jgi:hypothetical protein
VGLVILLAIKSWVDARKANPKGLPLPPGPKPAWLVGNVKDMPPSFEWLTYAEWGKKHGGLLSSLIAEVLHVPCADLYALRGHCPRESLRQAHYDPEQCGSYD